MIEKEELLKEFGARLGNTDAMGNFEKSGISQRTLDAYVDAIANSGVENADENFYATHVAMIETIGGQIRHEVAERFKSVQSTKQDPPKTTKTTEAPEKAEDVISQLQKQITDLVAKFEEQSLAQQKSAKVKLLEEAMKERGAEDSYVIKQVMKNATIDFSKEVEDIAEELLPIYDAVVKECRGDGERPRQGGNAGSSNDTEASRYFAAKRKREGWN